MIFWYVLSKKIRMEAPIEARMLLVEDELSGNDFGAKRVVSFLERFSGSSMWLVVESRD